MTPAEPMTPDELAVAHRPIADAAAARFARFARGHSADLRSECWLAVLRGCRAWLPGRLPLENFLRVCADRAARAYLGRFVRRGGLTYTGDRVGVRPPWQTELPEDLAGSTASPDVALDLAGALARLSPDERAAIDRHRTGATLAEAGGSRQTVWARERRAARALRAMVPELAPYPE